MGTTQAQQDSDIRQKLEDVREWAGERIKKVDVPPWVHFYCMKLNESLCQILYGWESPITPEGEGSPKSAERLDEYRPQSAGAPPPMGRSLSLPKQANNSDC